MRINENIPYESLKSAFEHYEASLIKNNIEDLDFYFWNSEFTVRLGVSENLYGSDAIKAYRRICQPVDKGRTLQNTIITTFGENFGTVSTEFNDGITREIGRQMQTWVRFNEEWKVVSAHVSIMK